jgi:beta-glucosidase
LEADMAVVSAPLDWAGVNYYSRSLIESDPQSPGTPKTVDPPGETNDLGWEIYPKGLTDLLVRVSRDYTKVPLYVTENGMSESDDTRRVDYYDVHLKAVLDAQRQGADVRGYFAWSLIDNFEWAHGYTSRFGIVHVDYETQKRTPKGSYRAFQGLLHNTR